MSLTMSRSFLRLVSIELVMHPLPPSSPVASSLSQHQDESIGMVFKALGDIFIQTALSSDRSENRSHKIVCVKAPGSTWPSWPHRAFLDDRALRSLSFSVWSGNKGALFEVSQEY